MDSSVTVRESRTVADPSDKEDLNELVITALGDRKRLQQLISSLKPTKKR